MEKKFTIYILAFIFLGFLHQSCETESKPDVIELEFGESYHFPENDLILKFNGVNSDSRCPTGVVCVWEGNAEIQFQMLNNSNISFALNSNSKFQTDTLLNGYRIELLTLIPYPEYNKEIKTNDYSVELAITKE